ncbi:hypothetical protein BDN72DRAFT_901710 [Pluteus cervinus]|uniref:Uncharacterized protein n=1 Tax=Pluteus cervinus TaxID=181527 RepID=A0ACD3AED2_9AGAR|nr:hypothetical protein BDN72DRAFT_901710 [Pluteus cervinus]
MASPSSKEIISSVAGLSCEELDAEIDSLLLLLQYYRSYRNQRWSTIQNVPDEIISRVFTEVYESDPDGLEWMGLGHVSREWRTIALGHQNLWSRIKLSPGRCDQALTFLDRSGGTSMLTIDASLLHPKHKKELETLQAILDNPSNLQRLQRLHVTAMNQSGWTTFGNNLTGGSQCSNLLTLDLAPLLSDKIIKIHSFNGCLNLKHLHLRNLKMENGFTWNSGLSLARNLVTLEIFCPEIRMNLSNLRGILRANPNLRAISLTDAFLEDPVVNPVPSVQSIPEESPIGMASLRSIKLVGIATSQVIQVFNSLHLPDACREIEIVADSSEDMTPFLDSHFHTLIQGVQHLASHTSAIAGLEVSFQLDQYLAKHRFQLAVETPTNWALDTSALSLSIMLRVPRVFSDPQIRNFVAEAHQGLTHMFPFMQLNYFSGTMQVNGSQDQAWEYRETLEEAIMINWESIFSTMINATALRLQDGWAASFLRHLGAQNSAGQALVNVQSLTFQDVDLVDDQFTVLEDYLNSRCESGEEVVNLALSNVDLSDDSSRDLHDLGSLVTNLYTSTTAEEDIMDLLDV